MELASIWLKRLNMNKFDNQFPNSLHIVKQHIYLRMYIYIYIHTQPLKLLLIVGAACHSEEQTKRGLQGGRK